MMDFQEELEREGNGWEAPDRPAFAGFWIRFWAYLLDLIVIGSIKRIAVIPLADYFQWTDGFFSLKTVLGAAVFYLYFVLMTKFFGQTLGKMAFGLKVVPLKGEKLDWLTVLFRELIGRYICSTLWVTYAVAAFTKKKQGIHDLFADTTVIHEEYVKRQTRPRPQNAY